MKSKQLRYEMKPCEKDDWIEVSETFFLNRLLESFYPITPILIRMLRGGEVASNVNTFRIIIRQSAKGIVIPDRAPVARTALN
jgi:hypothetical protein